MHGCGFKPTIWVMQPPAQCLTVCYTYDLHTRSSLYNYIMFGLYYVSLHAVYRHIEAMHACSHYNGQRVDHSSEVKNVLAL